MRNPTQNNIPGLQREPSQRCVGCGDAAELYCAACRVTPYCGERCQRRDWDTRHSAVCHNLARSVGMDVSNGKAEALTVTVGRRPHTPVHTPVNNARSAGFGEKVNAGQNVSPAVQLNNVHQAQQRNGNRNQDRRNQQHPRSNYGGSQVGNRSQVEQDSQPDVPNKKHSKNNGLRRFQKTPQQPLRQPTTMPQEQLADKTDTISITAKANNAEAYKPKTTNAEATKPVVEIKRELKAEPPKTTVPLASVTPRKPLVPSSFILQKLQAGAMFAATVVEKATASASKQAGFVCVTINEDVMDVYTQLCDDFSLQCEKEKEEYKPRIGETFSYFCKDDEGWYRARCLTHTRGALLDAGRVVSLEPSVCRKLPSAYATVPEFVAVIKMDGLQIGANLACTVVSSSAFTIKVTVTDDSGAALGEADATKWMTIVEYPQEPEEPQTDLSESKSFEPVKPVPEPAKKIQETVKPVVKTVESQAVVSKPVVSKPLVPDSYVVGNLKAGDMFLAQVGFFDDAERGYVSVAVHTDYSDAYTRICEEFPLKCMEDSVEYTPTIGETFAFLNKEDEGWYRARCLSRTRACLLDLAMVTSFEPSVCRKLPSGYADIPEFVAVIKSDKLVEDSNVDCVVVTTSPAEAKVQITGVNGEYQVKRWTPPIEYPVEPAESIPTAATSTVPTAATSTVPTAATSTVPTAATSTVPTAATAVIPTLLRPCLEHNALYILCGVTSLSRACVRPIDSKESFDAALHATVNYGLTAKPLTEPAQKGQIVVTKDVSDGLYYRAFVKRVSVAKNKYLIEYVEYGKEEIVPLERLYPCPSKLSLEAMPPQASLVCLSEHDAPLTPPATTYIDRLKDNAEHLILTIPGGEKSKASGSFVNLLIAKTCEPASQNIEDMCLQKLFYSDLVFTPFPVKSGPVTLTLPYCDANLLANGTLAGYVKGDEHAPKIFGELSQKIQEYAEGCKTPYRLTENEQLCIAKNSKVDNKWARAVVIDLDQIDTKAHRVMFIDHGNLEDVPAEHILKMMPEFVDRYPVATRQFDIKDFPVAAVSAAQIVRGMRFMSSRGGSELAVRAVRVVDDDTFEVEAPELMEAMTQP